MVRHAKGWRLDVRDRSNGPEGSTAVDDLKRSLAQMFGDGARSYPAGAYVDVFQIHNLNTMEEVEAIYEGLDNPDPQADRIGALAALRDYRDGANLTGLNPKEEKLILHVGITSHISSPVLMECIQRDTTDLIDTMLVAINANDRRYFNHQYNAIPVGGGQAPGHHRHEGLRRRRNVYEGAPVVARPRRRGDDRRQRRASKSTFGAVFPDDAGCRDRNHWDRAYRSGSAVLPVDTESGRIESHSGGSE